MKRIVSLALVAGALSMSAFGADKGMSAGEAGAIMATDFCGQAVGESPDNIEPLARSIPGLHISRPLSAAEVPEPFRSQFAGTLKSSPYALYHVLTFPGVDDKSGGVMALIDRAATLCQTTTLAAKDTVARLVERLQRATAWTAAPNERDARVYRRKASTGRGVGMMFLSGRGVTPINTYLMQPEKGSATPEAIEEFARDVIRACTHMALGKGAFESQFFEPRAAPFNITRDGPMLMKMRQAVPTAIVAFELKGAYPSCTIISGDPVDAVPAIQAALTSAFMALPGAQDAGAEGWSITDAATGKKARMKIEPFRDRISAHIEPIP